MASVLSPPPLPVRLSTSNPGEAGEARAKVPKVKRKTKNEATREKRMASLERDKRARKDLSDVKGCYPKTLQELLTGGLTSMAWVFILTPNRRSIRFLLNICGPYATTYVTKAAYDQLPNCDNPCDCVYQGERTAGRQRNGPSEGKEG